MRLIAKLDLKNNYVIKGINLEGLRKVGNPIELAKKYFEIGVDEIYLNDCVASLYSRNNIFPIINKITKNIFIPITLGGGLRSLIDINKALINGSDKVAINTYATENPEFIYQAVREFGSSTIIIGIEAKQVGDQRWEVYKNYGRDRTQIDLFYWLDKIKEYDCGEIHLTSIDYEGLLKGFDLNLIEKIYNYVDRPFIINGGCHSIEDIKFIKKNFPLLDISVSSALHYNKLEVNKI